VNDHGRLPAFLLFGDLYKLGPYLTALRGRQLRILTITTIAESALERHAARCVDDPAHELAAIDAVRFAAAGDDVAVLDQIQQWSEAYDIRALFSAGESFVTTAGLVADLLGLPGVGLRAARVCRDKYLQRRYLAPWSPRSRLIPPDRRNDAGALVGGGYPMVVKPPHLYSSIGVREVHDEAELTVALESFRSDQPVLVEERVVGREVSVESLVRDGTVVFESITQKATNEDSTHHFVELVHSMPCASLSNVERERVLATNRAVLARLRFEYGMTHAEYRVAEDGRVLVMEVAARPPGGGVMALYQLATADSMEAAIVALALGEPVRYPALTRHARQIYLEHGPGVLNDVVVDGFPDVQPLWLPETAIWPSPPAGDAAEGAALRTVVVLKPRGEPLSYPMVEASDRAVTVLLDAPSLAELDNVDRRVRAAVRLKVGATG
jgi:biotin carboxylase